MDIWDEAQEFLRDPRYSPYVSRASETEQPDEHAFMLITSSLLPAERAEMRLESAKRDRQYFVEHLPRLLKQYPGKFVAIRDQAVADLDSDLDALLLRLRKARDARGPFYVEKLDKHMLAARLGYRGLNS